MILIKSNENNIYFNLALEEYMIKNFEIPVFIIYRNNKAIVTGKHQNLLSEINYKFVYENNICLARRISGGGTVFHDKGCLNFAYIGNIDKNHLIDYENNLNPVLSFLRSYDLDITFDGKNSIFIENKKISGNSQHIFKNRLLHHGTLLFDTNLELLEKSLSFINKNYIDKAVKSKPHEVTNLKYYLNINTEQFEFNFYNYIKNYYNAREYVLSDNDMKNINQLVDEKYKTWDWIYGYSPDYKFCNVIKYMNDEFKIVLEVQKGIIKNVIIFSKKKELENQLKKHLLNVPHDLIFLLQDDFFKINKELLYLLF